MATNLSHYFRLEMGSGVRARGSLQPPSWPPGFDMAHFDCRQGSTPRPISRRPINEIPANPLTLNHLPRLDLTHPERSGGHSASAVVWPNLLTINKINLLDTATRRVDNGSLEM